MIGVHAGVRHVQLARGLLSIQAQVGVNSRNANNQHRHAEKRNEAQMAVGVDIHGAQDISLQCGRKPT